MKTEILTILRESEGYVSGQQLCEQMHVSRTAVWKVIEQLKKEGYTIEAVRNKGYRLTESPDVMSSAEIESLLETAWAGQDVLYLDETDSTNVQAKKLGEAEGKHGTLIVSDRQTAGKGRRGRGWDSPSGASIYMSILLRPDILPDKAPMLTLVMALAVVRAVREITGEEAGIKWPNDIVLNKKKICGILTEMSAEIDYINHVVIGVGINVNTEDFPEEIKKTATSIFIETGKKWKRSEFIAAAMKYFEEYYEIFLKTQNLKMLQEIYNGFLVNKDAQVRVLEPGNEFDGCALGINETGELLVRKSDGEITKIYAGEVSVRGIYGYV